MIITMMMIIIIITWYNKNLISIRMRTSLVTTRITFFLSSFLYH